MKPGPRNVCCKFVAQAALDTQSDLSVLVADTSSWARDGILTSTVQPWRDRTFVHRYFEPPTQPSIQYWFEGMDAMAAASSFSSSADAPFYCNNSFFDYNCAC